MGGDVITKSGENRLCEALATFPPKGKVLKPNPSPDIREGIITKEKMKASSKNNFRFALISRLVAQFGFPRNYFATFSKSSMHPQVL
jgi:hypothetical protein